MQNLIQMSAIDSLLLQGRGSDTAIAVPDGPSLTYARLRQMVHEAALRMVSFGVQPEDRVATVFPNGPEAIVLFLAAANVATACPLNPAYTEAEFRFYLEDTGARFLLAARGDGADARKALSTGSTVIEAEIDDDGRLSLESSGPAQQVRTIRPRDPDDIALVLHTSGTTSRPKRVPLRHRNLTASVANIVESYRLGPEDVSLCVMPLFHVHGLVASALSTLASGGTVSVPRRFTPLMFWPAARQARPTWYTASPTPHQLILMRTDENRPPGTERLRFVRSCSSALSPDLMARMEARLGVPVVEAYGMTEASHQTRLTTCAACSRTGRCWSSGGTNLTSQLPISAHCSTPINCFDLLERVVRRPSECMSGQRSLRRRVVPFSTAEFGTYLERCRQLLPGRRPTARGCSITWPR